MFFFSFFVSLWLDKRSRWQRNSCYSVVNFFASFLLKTNINILEQQRIMDKLLGGTKKIWLHY